MDYYGLFCFLFLFLFYFFQASAAGLLWTLSFQSQDVKEKVGVAGGHRYLFKKNDCKKVMYKVHKQVDTDTYKKN